MVCFDLLEFLKKHVNVLEFTEEDVNNVCGELRMVDTRDLNHLRDMTDVYNLACLNAGQKRRLWTLVLEVQADRRYSLDSAEAKVAGWLRQLANLNNLL